MVHVPKNTGTKSNRTWTTSYLHWQVVSIQ